MRAHFVNENLGGHATMHLHLRAGLADHPDVEASFFDVPPPGWVHRVARLPIPGLDRLDLDLTALRDQLPRAAVVARHLRQQRADVDVLHLYTHNAALLSVATMRRVPSVVSLDATNRQNAFHLPYRRPTRFTPTSVRPVAALEARVYEEAHAVVTHSRWAANSVLTYGVDPAKVQVIPFGIEVGPRLPPIRDGGPPRIVFIATTMGRKGGWTLLRLWREQLADRSRLVLVTPDSVPSEPGLEVHNDIRPGDGRLAEVLRSADVFAMPGDLDAFGYALLEAMSFGLPAVARRAAAIPEIVAEGTSGLLAPVGDDAAFAAALRRLLDDPQARADMGETAYRRAAERFDARTTTTTLVEVLRGVR